MVMLSAQGMNIAQGDVHFGGSGVGRAAQLNGVGFDSLVPKYGGGGRPPSEGDRQQVSNL